MNEINKPKLYLAILMIATMLCFAVLEGFKKAGRPCRRTSISCGCWRAAAFGQLKSNNGFNRFTLKGLTGVGIEFALMAIGHNLRKMAVKARNNRTKGSLDPTIVKKCPLYCHLYGHPQQAA